MSIFVLMLHIHANTKENIARFVGKMFYINHLKNHFIRKQIVLSSL